MSAISSCLVFLWSLLQLVFFWVTYNGHTALNVQVNYYLIQFLTIEKCYEI